MLKTLLISVLMSAAILGSSTLVYVNETSPHRSAQPPSAEDRSAPVLLAPAPASAGPVHSDERAVPGRVASLDR